MSKHSSNKIILTPKMIEIDYAELAQEAKNDTNDVNQFIKNAVPTFINDGYKPYYSVFCELLNMDCFTVTKKGLLLFHGCIGLFKASPTDKFKIIITNSFKNMVIYQNNHKDSELYGVTSQKVVINHDLTVAQSITFAYVNWLKKEITKQINTPLTPDRFSLLMATKRNLFNVEETSKQLMRLCN